jgi:hypothetical protein
MGGRKTCFNIGGQRSQLAEKYQWNRVSHESGKEKTTFGIVYDLLCDFMQAWDTYLAIFFILKTCIFSATKFFIDLK